MQSLFSPDSKIMQALSRVADLLILNLVFLVTCLPVFTIGAASSALYTICFRFDTDRERTVFRGYLRAFLENFRQGTVLWLLLLLCCAASAVNAMLFYSLSGVLHYAFLLFTALLAVALLVLSYVFPLLSQFQNTVMTTCKNAFYLSIGYLPRSLVITLINIFPFALLYLDPYLFFQTGMLWISLYFSAAAYINSMLLKKVFAPYMEEPEETK